MNSHDRFYLNAVFLIVVSGLIATVLNTPALTGSVIIKSQSKVELDTQTITYLGGVEENSEIELSSKEQTQTFVLVDVIKGYKSGLQAARFMNIQNGRTFLVQRGSWEVIDLDYDGVGDFKVLLADVNGDSVSLMFESLKI